MRSAAIAGLAVAAGLASLSLAPADCVDEMQAISRRLDADREMSDGFRRDLEWVSAPAGGAVATLDGWKKNLLSVWQPSRGRRRLISRDVRAFSWSPDGTTLWFLTDKGKVGRAILVNHRVQVVSLDLALYEHGYGLVSEDARHAWVLVKRQRRSDDLCRVSFQGNTMSVACRPQPESVGASVLIVAVEGGVIVRSREDRHHLIEWAPGGAVLGRPLPSPDERVWLAAWLPEERRVSVVSLAEKDRVPRVSKMTVAGEVDSSLLGEGVCREDPLFSSSGWIAFRVLHRGDDSCFELGAVVGDVGGGPLGAFVTVSRAAVTCFVQ